MLQRKIKTKKTVSCLHNNLMLDQKKTVYRNKVVINLITTLFLRPILKIAIKIFGRSINIDIPIKKDTKRIFLDSSKSILCLGGYNVIFSLAKNLIKD